jgi:hypothetical protein
MFKWMMENNLNWSAIFHNHIDVILKEKVKEIPEIETLSDKDKVYWKNIYENNFPKQLRNTTFLMMFGHFEEMLYLLWKHYNPSNVELDRKGFGITKFKTYIKTTLQTNIGQHHGYQQISDAQKIRNSLLHIAGRISLSKDAQALNDLIVRNPNLYSIHLDRVQLSYDGVLNFQKAVRSITEELLNKALKSDS